MASIKFALLFVALLGLLQAFRARHLQDVIQMVTEEEDLQSPPSSPLLQGKTNYGRDNPKAPPSPPQVEIVYGQYNNVKENPSLNDAPSQGETTYGRDNPKAPSPPKVAPSRGQTTYGENNPIETTSSQELADLLDILSQIRDSSMDHITYGRDDPTKPPTPDSNGSKGQGMYSRDDPTEPLSPDSNGSKGQGMYGRDNPKAPSPPKVAPSRGQTTYGENNPIETTSSQELADLLDIFSQISDSSMDHITYGRDDSRRPLSPDPNGSEGHDMYGRDDPTKPPTPDSNGSKGQGMYSRDNPTEPLSPDSNGSKGQGMYGRDNPSVPTPSKPADPTHTMLSGSFCVNGGSLCTGLSPSVVDGQRNPSSRAPKFTFDVKRKPVENQLHYIASYLASYVIKVFNFLG